MKGAEQAWCGRHFGAAEHPLEACQRQGPQTIRERTSISMKRIHEQGYNKGEWAELYVFLQLLGSGRLDAADRDLQCKPGAFLEVSKVFRHEKGRPETEYVVVPEFDTVEVRCDGVRVARVSMRECAEQARALFEHLTSHKGSGKVMCAPEGVCDFAEAIGVTNPKAPQCCCRRLVRRQGRYRGRNARRPQCPGQPHGLFREIAVRKPVDAL